MRRTGVHPKGASTPRRSRPVLAVRLSEYREIAHRESRCGSVSPDRVDRLSRFRARGPLHASSDHGALARSCTHREAPAEGAETVLHVLEAGTFDAFGLESDAIVLD